MLFTSAVPLSVSIPPKKAGISTTIGAGVEDLQTSEQTAERRIQIGKSAKISSIRQISGKKISNAITLKLSNLTRGAAKQYGAQRNKT